MTEKIRKKLKKTLDNRIKLCYNEVTIKKGEIKMYKVTYKEGWNDNKESVKYFKSMAEVNGFKVVSWHESGYYDFKVEKIEKSS